jgi:hypothetical protein
MTITEIPVRGSVDTAVLFKRTVDMHVRNLLAKLERQSGSA